MTWKSPNHYHIRREHVYVMCMISNHTQLICSAHRNHLFLASNCNDGGDTDFQLVPGGALERLNAPFTVTINTSSGSRYGPWPGRAPL